MEVFVSRPTWVASEFREGLQTFETQMRNMDLMPRTLGVSDYPNKSPLDEVIELIAGCVGAVILGYPQMEVKSGTLKGESIESPIGLGTEWNHLEAGLAYSRGLPLMVIHHQSVSRGIFDRGVLNAFLHSVDLSQPNWSMTDPVNGAIKRFATACGEGRPSYTHPDSQAANVPDKPFCPNCSTASKKFFLRPIGKQFQTLAGGKWECPHCKYVE